MGQIRFNRFNTDMQKVIEGILQEFVLKYNGGDAFLISYGSPERQKVNKGIGTVYFWREEGFDNGQEGVCSQSRTYTVRIGVKESCSSNPMLATEQVDEYLAVFQEWGQINFLFSFQGSPIGHLTEAGIGMVDTIGSNTTTDGEYFYTEFQVSLTAYYTNKIKTAA